MSKRVFAKNANVAWDKFEVEDLVVTGTSTTKTNETLEGDTQIGNEASDNLDILATLNSSFALGGNDLTNGGRMEGSTLRVLNSGSGADPDLTSSSSSKRVLVEDELEINNVGGGSNPVLSSNGGGQELFVDAVLIHNRTVRSNSDNQDNVGANNRRYSEAHATQFMVEASSGDGNPVVQVDSDGVKFGPGGGSGLDLGIFRNNSNRLEIRTAADDAYQELDMKRLRLSADIRPISSQSVGIFAEDSDDGSNVQVATLNRASTPTFDLDQARLYKTGGTFTSSTLSGNISLAVGDAEFQKLDPSGTNRNVTLPSAGNSEGKAFEILNTGNSAASLTVQNSGGTTVATLSNGEKATFVCDGTSWTEMGVVSVTLV